MGEVMVELGQEVQFLWVDLHLLYCCVCVCVCVGVRECVGLTRWD